MASGSDASCTVAWPCARGALVQLAGQHDVTTLPVLRHALAPLDARYDLVVVIDLSRVTFIDVSVLGLLAYLAREVTGRRGKFRLRPGTAPFVVLALELTGWLSRPSHDASLNGVPPGQLGR